MKCDFCGGPLSLEDERCPRCGQPNKHARRHIEDMRHYKGEFEDTKKHVYEKTKRYTQLAVRAVILSVLVILSVGMYVLADNAYSIVRDWKRSSANRKYEEYSRIMDGYLEEGEFRAFNAFREAHEIGSYGDAYSERYGSIIPVVYYYVQTMDELWSYAFPGEYTLETQAQWTAETMDYFYKDRWMEAEDEESEALFLKVTGEMESQVEQFLITFCGFTQEEAAQMKELSSARRQILLEDKLEERLGNEE